MSNNGANSGFILKHCTGHKPANKEIDVPMNYGDYYFIEALTRYQKAKLMTSISQPKATNFKIFPNPAKNSFVVHFTQQEAKFIRVFDMNGCVVMVSEPNTTIACDFLHKGNYIVQIEYSNGKLESQLVIKD
ncbi:MAG: T9SS type A sorting domain-containing protein [Paludibacter sp.]